MAESNKATKPPKTPCTEMAKGRLRTPPPTMVDTRLNTAEAVVAVLSGESYRTPRSWVVDERCRRGRRGEGWLSSSSFSPDHSLYMLYEERSPGTLPFDHTVPGVHVFEWFRFICQTTALRLRTPGKLLIEQGAGLPPWRAGPVSPWLQAASSKHDSRNERQKKRHFPH